MGALERARRPHLAWVGMEKAGNTDSRWDVISNTSRGGFKNNHNDRGTMEKQREKNGKKSNIQQADSLCFLVLEFFNGVCDRIMCSERKMFSKKFLMTWGRSFQYNVK